MKEILSVTILGLFLLSMPLNVFAQAEIGNQAKGEKAGMIADADDENQQITNDEGYGQDDSEYYSSENETVEPTEDVVNDTDDEITQDNELVNETDEGAVDDGPSDNEQK